MFTNNVAGPLRDAVVPSSSVIKLPAETRVLPSRRLMKGINLPTHDQVCVCVRGVCVCVCVRVCVYGRKCEQGLIDIQYDSLQNKCLCPFICLSV